MTRRIVQGIGRINQFDEGDPLQDIGSSRFHAIGHEISFGNQLPHFATEQAIFHHTGINPANFVGYGRHNVNRPNQRCQNAGNPIYQLRFPAHVIWHNVPQNAIPDGAFTLTYSPLSTL